MTLLQDAYSSLWHWSGGSEATLSILGSFLVTFLSFWLYNAVLLIVDLTGSPKWLLQYKVQEYKTIEPDKLKKAFKVVMFNMVVFNGISGFFVYDAQKRLGISFHPDDVPSYTRIILELMLFTALQEVLFYYSHRMLHHPFFYQRIHKVHHQWTAPMGMVAVYAHPVEHFLSNGLPVIVGPMLMRSHLVTFWIWFALLLFVTVSHHSGYHFPYLISPQFHDFHHLKFNWNFGTWGLLDWLHGTDSAFRTHVAWSRHRTLTGLTPMDKLYPDTQKAQ